MRLLTSLYLLLLASLSYAGNSTDAEEEIVSKEIETPKGLYYSDYVYETLKYAAKWAKISYCTVLYPTFQPGPLADACPSIQFCQESPDSNVIEVFRPNLKELEISGTAYVAVENASKKVFVIFRGSMSAGDWFTDVIFNQCPYAPVLSNDGINGETFKEVTRKTSARVISRLIRQNSNTFQEGKGCYVHCGVYVAYSKFANEVFAAAKPYLDQDYQLIVSGHSLGGGYAYLAAMDFIVAGYRPLVVTLEALRIGNPAWNALLDMMYNTKENAKIVAKGGDLPIPSLTRVFQTTDIVPRLPPNLPGFPAYTHSGLEFEITKLQLPQEKKDVIFLGAADNYVNEPFNFNLEDIRSVSMAYQHINTFYTMAPPCGDWTFPFRTKREDGYEEFWS